MSSLREVEKLLAGMTRAEKAQLLQWVVQDLGDAFPGTASTQESLVANPVLFALGSRCGAWNRRGG
jgi:hypothetical protein